MYRNVKQFSIIFIQARDACKASFCLPFTLCAPFRFNPFHSIPFYCIKYEYYTFAHTNKQTYTFTFGQSHDKSNGEKKNKKKNTHKHCPCNENVNRKSKILFIRNLDSRTHNICIVFRSHRNLHGQGQFLFILHFRTIDFLFGQKSQCPFAMSTQAQAERYGVLKPILEEPLIKNDFNISISQIGMF